MKVTTLHDTLGFSEATLRRDLQQLEDDGLLRCTRGGALRLKPEVVQERSVSDKAASCAAEKQAIGRAERVVVVADHTKIGRVTLALNAPCSAIHTLITDSAAPTGELEALRAAGIEVLIAD